MARAKARRNRSVTETLLSIVLGLELVVVFFVTLTAFGLRAVEPIPAFAGGAALAILIAVAIRVLRYRWGVWVGWAAQLALVATGIVMPIMFLVAGGFVAFWVFCLVKGSQLDATAPTADPPKESP